MIDHDVGGIVLKFFGTMTRAIRGEPYDPLALCHDDVTWTMTGSAPVSGTYRGLSDFRNTIGCALAESFRPGATFGVYVREIVVENQRAAVVVRSHGESAHGHQYNNIYLFFIEIRDGRLFKVVECYDGSLVNQSVFDTHIE